MSWAGKILRVNLTAGTVKSEPLNMDWARAYLGSRGLATKYLVEEIDPKVDPLSPDNKIIWATGPLTGTMASTGGRYTVVTKGPLTGAIACSNSGGYWGAELKMAGWDMVIFEGKSAKPVYLFIQDDVAELRDAAHLWGKTVWETEETLKKQLQDPLVRVSSIGGAGENQVLYAAVVNDLHRAAGRSGVGAVMGSKNLKAIAVRGTKGVGNIADPKAFMKVTAEKKKILADNAVTGQGLPTYGTQVLMNVINEIGALPTRNHRDVQFEGAKDISAEAMATPRKTDGKKPLVTNQACFGCTIACGRIQKIDQGHFTVREQAAVLGRLGRPRVRSRLGAGRGQRRQRPRRAAVRQPAVQRARHGPDQLRRHHRRGDGAVRDGRAHQGAARHRRQVRLGAGAGALRRDHRQGRGLRQGDRPGLGKRLTAKYGHPDLSMIVKGQEFPAYDARGIQGMGLAYATSNRGACHLRGYTVASEVLGIPVKTDPLTAEGKPELVKAFQDATAAFDSSGHVHLHHLRLGPARPAPQVAAGLRRRSSRWRTWPRSASASGTWSATSTTAPASPPRTTRCRKRLLTEAGQDRPGQGPGQQAAGDAAEVLRGARLGRRRHAQARDAHAPGPVGRRRCAWHDPQGGSADRLVSFQEEPTR